MTFWTFLLLLILVSGVVSYLGDTIAKKVGKKHWRLFGLRPKQTGTVVAVLTGVAIALGAFATFLLVNRSARETIFQAEQVRAERNKLRTETNDLTERLTAIRSEASQTYGENLQLQQENDFFTKTNKQLAKDLEANLGNQKQLKTDLESALQERQNLQNQVNELAKTSNEQQARLQQKNQEISKSTQAINALKQQQQTTIAELKQRQLRLQQDAQNAISTLEADTKLKTAALAQEIITAKSQLSRYEQATRSARDNYQALQNKSAKLTKQLSQMSGQLKRIQEEKATLEGNLSLVSNDAVQKSDIDLARLSKTLQNTQKQLKLAQQNQDKLYSALKRQLVSRPPYTFTFDNSQSQDSLVQAVERKFTQEGLMVWKTKVLSNKPSSGTAVVRISNIDANLKTTLELEWLPSKKLYEEDEVVAYSTLTLPTDLTTAAKKIETLQALALQKAKQAGLDTATLSRPVLDLQDYANYIAQATQNGRKHSQKIAIVAKRAIYSNETPLLGIVIGQ